MKLSARSSSGQPRNEWDIFWAPADDGATGAHTRRAGLTWTLEQLAAGNADGLVVAKLTRLSRSVADFAQVLRVAKKQGWTMAALDLGIDTGTVNRRLVATIVMSVAGWKREIISERTTEALAEAKESGVQLGRPILVEDDTIKRVRRLRTKGHTLRAIADQLNADGVPTAHGGARWRSSTLRGVLRRCGGDPRPRTPARAA